ncbi:Fic family protein [Micromonospora sp. NPDC050417]|uniref:Fic family protein n=1 Tax=Micromonospora sp. NPDC050417 TaxID=3364280 RepID=UPI0037911F02
MIYANPALTAEDQTVLAEVHEMRRHLASALRAPRRWQGGLRRTMLARAIRGSNSIEGYVVAEDDAAAALDDEEPLGADERTWAEIRGYRQALGYVLQMAGDPHFAPDTSAVRSMHYMMLAHDLSKSPGQYRMGPIFVHDEKRDVVVYEGPEAGRVPELMEELAASLRSDTDMDPLVRGAMAHLNLVMIHPFRDGNGRMARALQTLTISRQTIIEPAFSSVEEWLGHNTDDYYQVLAITGQGTWRPRPDAQLWAAFNIRAHHMQAQTVARRVVEASEIWAELDNLVGAHKLPERIAGILYEAVLGYRVRRSGYMKMTGIEKHTATRDLGRLADLGLLRPQGETRGRHYTAGERLIELREECRRRRPPLTDPYPWMRTRLAQGNEVPLTRPEKAST